MNAESAPISIPDTSAARDKRRALIELSLAYTLILAVIWTPRPWQKAIYLVAAAFLIFTFCRSFPGWRAMGLRATNFPRSIWVVGVALIACCTAAFLASRMHTLHSPGGPTQFVQRYSGYVIFAFVQQALLQDFFLARLLRLIRTPIIAALSAAAIFSLAHLPNPILTLATFVWGLAACLHFLRYRNLYTLAIAHAILGITIAICVPGPVIRNMRVGLGYLTYSTHHVDHRSH